MEHREVHRERNTERKELSSFIIKMSRKDILKLFMAALTALYFWRKMREIKLKLFDILPF